VGAALGFVENIKGKRITEMKKTFVNALVFSVVFVYQPAIIIKTPLPLQIQC
jgi:hypothetical protein